ncbi:hypothetical protein J8I26_04055 [Herbaspirillum sp. LeCh32-8]|nr:hypothetical protein [Herbaspirillum sp. LeCh32-8]
MNNRLDAEWVTLNAMRGLTKIASHGDIAKSTYDNALNLGGVLYPELLGADASILRRERMSDISREYRQRASLKTIKEQVVVTPLELLQADMADLEDLLSLAKQQKSGRSETDQLQRKLAGLRKSENELKLESHTENQLIFRDAHNVDREMPAINSGKGFRDFELPNGNVLRVRVLHPDQPEHITGADFIYERHSADDMVSIVAIQYKIWEEDKLYLNDPRMQTQLERLKAFVCDRNSCVGDKEAETYRFPCCAAFLRPTDRLQDPNQKFITRGEHIPICKIEKYKSPGSRGGDLLEYEKIKEVSLSAETFEFLFNNGKIGSRLLAQDDLLGLYRDLEMNVPDDRVVILAQEFGKRSLSREIV